MYRNIANISLFLMAKIIFWNILNSVTIMKQYDLCTCEIAMF